MNKVIALPTLAIQNFFLLLVISLFTAQVSAEDLIDGTNPTKRPVIHFIITDIDAGMINIHGKNLAISSDYMTAVRFGTIWRAKANDRLDDELYQFHIPTGLEDGHYSLEVMHFSGGAPLENLGSYLYSQSENLTDLPRVDYLFTLSRVREGLEGPPGPRGFFGPLGMQGPPGPPGNGVQFAEIDLDGNLVIHMESGHTFVAGKVNVKGTASDEH